MLKAEIKNAPFVRELCDCAANMYRMGWNERNGGNISVWLTDAEVREYFADAGVIRTLDAGFDCSEVSGQVFLVTASGKYFKDVKDNPEETLGVVRIARDGRTLEILWGFKGGGRPTSEFPTHIMNHMARRRADANQRVVLHTHPTNLLAMTRVHEADEEKFSKSLWKTCTECIIVFPEGVALIPWMVCGNEEIGRATAEKMKDFRAVVWMHHGLFAVGDDLNDTFGLAETIEKAAEIYMKTAHLPILQTIEDAQLIELSEAFNVRDKVRYL